jgi:hypothetical protein
LSRQKLIVLRDETVCLVVCCNVGAVPDSLQSRSHGTSSITFMEIIFTG